MIKLQYCNEKIFVWNPSDASLLRRDYRIVGSFIGSLPGFSRQNTDLGLPLLLMPEEAKLLVDNGIAVIVNYKLCVNSETKMFYKELKTNFYRENCEQFKAERKSAILQKSDKIIAGKMKKYKSDNEIDRKELEAKIIQEQIDRIPDITPESCATKLYIQCPLDKRVITNIDWNYPKTEKQIIRYQVYKDMWDKNYYLTSGIKFGCDFLAYEFDPLLFHSKYMIVCKESDSPITELELQTYGRLAKSVRKTVLIAICIYLQNDKTIEYKTIEWQTNDR